MSKIIPQPRSWPVIGTIGALIASGGAEKLHKYVDNRHKELGPIYREKIGPTEAIFISDPDYIRRVFANEGKYPQHIIPDAWQLYNKTYGQKRGLLFMDGEEWHKFRKILNGIVLKPNTDKLTAYLKIPAENLTINWQKNGLVDNLEQQLYEWSLKSIIAVLAGEEIPDLAPKIRDLSQTVREIFATSATLSLMPVQIAQKLHLPVWQQFVHAVDQSFQSANFLLNFLNNQNGLLNDMRLSGITGDFLNRIVVDLILAAGDTTAYTTQWLFFLLATNKHTQNEIYQSLKHEQFTNYPENQFLKGALRETLRLYPVAPFLTRYLPDTVEINGYTLNKGELIIMSLYSSGRDDASFPSPELFQPDRWFRVEGGYKNVKNANGSLPFAMGARSCIGRKIAETQIALLTGLVLKKKEITCLNTKQVDIKLKLITVPSAPIQLTLRHR